MSASGETCTRPPHQFTSSKVHNRHLATARTRSARVPPRRVCLGGVAVESQISLWLCDGGALQLVEIYLCLAVKR